MAPTSTPEDAIEQLGGIALFLEALLRERGMRLAISIWAVSRAIHRQRDPLPTQKVMGRRVALPSLVRAWFRRQSPEQLELFTAPAAPIPQRAPKAPIE